VRPLLNTLSEYTTAVAASGSSSSKRRRRRRCCCRLTRTMPSTARGYAPSTPCVCCVEPAQSSRYNK
jgi:hypothetical protein